MTGETLHRLHTRHPFTPFVLNMADGRRFKVTHPEVLLLGDGDFEHIDVLMIASITELTARNGHRRKAG